MILRGVGTLNPSATMTYADLNYGLPNMLVCIEMAFFSLFFFYAYPWSPYLLKNQRLKVAGGDGLAEVRYMTEYQGGPFGISALLSMWNPFEVIQAIIFTTQMSSVSRRGRRIGAVGAEDSEQEFNLISHQQPADDQPSMYSQEHLPSPPQYHQKEYARGYSGYGR